MTDSVLDAADQEQAKTCAADPECKAVLDCAATCPPVGAGATPSP